MKNILNNKSLTKYIRNKAIKEIALFYYVVCYVYMCKKTKLLLL